MSGLMDAHRWAVPADFPGARIFVICGGESVKAQRKLLDRIKGPILAVKQSALLRPDAWAMLVAARHDPVLCAEAFRRFKGQHIISRKILGGLPEQTKYIGRTKGEFSTNPLFVGGKDTGTSAINIAFHAIGGKGEIVLLGYDMTGGRWLNGELPHHLPFPPQTHFDRHLICAREMAANLAALGVKVWNTSPISKATFFEYKPLKELL